MVSISSKLSALVLNRSSHITETQMRLREIVLAKKMELPASDHRHAYYSTIATQAEVISTFEGSRYQLLRHENTYLLQRLADRRVLGWCDLLPATVASHPVYTLSLLYLLPEVRKTFGAGLFIYALKEVLDRPVVLSTDEMGGVLFADGLTLVQRFAREWSKFKVSLLDLSTGETADLPDDLSLLQRVKFRGKTLMFEGTGLGFALSVAGQPLHLSLFDLTESL
jgi:hypothetical protein